MGDKKKSFYAEITDTKLLLSEGIDIFSVATGNGPIRTELQCTVKNITANDFLNTSIVKVFTYYSLLTKNPITGENLKYEDIFDSIIKKPDIGVLFIKSLEYFLSGHVDVLVNSKQFRLVIEDKKVLINEELFVEIQKALLAIFKAGDTKKQKFNTQTKQADEIARKIEAGRKKLAKAKSKDGLTIDKVIIILSAHTNKNIEEIKKMSYFLMISNIEQLGKKDAYDVGIMARMNGAKNVKLKHWLS